MARLDRRARVFWLPAQTPGLAKAAGLDPADLEQAAWALMPDGSWLWGGMAVLAAGDAVVAGHRGPLTAAGRLPVLRWLVVAVYRVVARHRGRLPGTADWGPGRRPPPMATEVELEIRRRRGEVRLRGPGGAGPSR